MPIKIEITGNHATDIVAEVQTLAAVFGVGGTEKNVAGAASGQTASTTSAPTSQAGSTAAQTTGGKTEAKTLNRKEQDEAVAEMIKAGQKDDRFELLTKGRQNEVNAALEKAAEPKKEDSVDDMFDDESEAEEVVTREMVSKLMGTTCKDEDGKTIQDKALKVRTILVDVIPEGQDIKVANVPDDKLAGVYAAIKKIGG